ncbi:MAG: ArsR/SmtB family transcription factor [Faecalimonas sp.]
MERTENLNFNQTDRVAAIGKALSSEIRIQILEALEEQEHNVNELAELLELPASSTAMHVRVLEEAGLIETELRAAVRGSEDVKEKEGDKPYQIQASGKERLKSGERSCLVNYVDYHVEPTCD